MRMVRWEEARIARANAVIPELTDCVMVTGGYSRVAALEGGHMNRWRSCSVCVRNLKGAS